MDEYQLIMSLPDELIDIILQYMPIYKFFPNKLMLDCQLPPIIDTYITTRYRSLPIIYFEELEYFAEFQYSNKYGQILYDKIYKTLLSFLPYCNNNVSVKFLIKRSERVRYTWSICAIDAYLYSSRNNYKHPKNLFECIDQFISHYIYIYFNNAKKSSLYPHNISLELYLDDESEKHNFKGDYKNVLIKWTRQGE